MFDSGGDMQIARAFGAPTRDPKWLGKVAIAVLVSFVPILSLAVAGWGIQYLADSAHGGDGTLPTWSDLGGHWVRGLCFGVASLVLYLPALLIVALSGIPSVVLGSVTSYGSPGLANALGSVFIGVIVALLYVVAVSILEQAARTNYAIHGEFSSLFRVSEIIARVRAYPSGYFTAWIMGIVAIWGVYAISFVFALIVNAIPFIGAIISLAIVPVVMGMGILAGMGVNALLGQYAATAYELTPGGATDPGAWTSSSPGTPPWTGSPGSSPWPAPVSPAVAATTLPPGLTGQAAVAALLAQTRPPMPKPESAPPSQPVAEPALERAPERTPAPEAAPALEPIPGPGPEPEPAPAAESALEAALVPAPELTPSPAVEPEQAPVPVIEALVEPIREVPTVVPGEDLPGMQGTAQALAAAPEVFPSVVPADEAPPALTSFAAVVEAPLPEAAHSPGSVSEDVGVTRATEAAATTYALVRESGPGRANEKWVLPSSGGRIGRDDGCFVSIDDGKASRVHATVSVTVTGVTITDLGSSNGTYIGDQRISAGPVALCLGDRFRIGDTTFVVALGRA